MHIEATKKNIGTQNSNKDGTELRTQEAAMNIKTQDVFVELYTPQTKIKEL